MRKSALLLVSAMLFIFVAVPFASAEIVVVKTKKYDGVLPGDIIKTGTKLSIPEGSSVMVIDDTGKKINIKGPFAGTISPTKDAPEQTGMIASISALIKKAMEDKDLRSLITGKKLAFRAVGKPVPNPWGIDIANEGAVCVKKGETPLFWREKTGKETEFELYYEKEGQKTLFKMEKGKRTVKWPVDVDLSDKAEYSLKIGEETKNMKIHIIPNDLPTRAHQAEAMTKNGCEKQAILLVVTADVDALLDEFVLEGSF